MDLRGTILLSLDFCLHFVSKVGLLMMQELKVH